MATVEERLVKTETRLDEHSQLFVMLFGRLDHFERRMDSLETRMDARFDAIDRRFELLDTKFLWLIGLYVTSILACAAAIIARG